MATTFVSQVGNMHKYKMEIRCFLSYIVPGRNARVVTFVEFLEQLFQHAFFVQDYMYEANLKEREKNPEGY